MYTQMKKMDEDLPWFEMKFPVYMKRNVRNCCILASVKQFWYPSNNCKNILFTYFTYLEHTVYYTAVIMHLHRQHSLVEPLCDVLLIFEGYHRKSESDADRFNSTHTSVAQELHIT